MCKLQNISRWYCCVILVISLFAFYLSRDAAWAQATWTQDGDLLYTTVEHVGVGTTEPLRKLDIRADTSYLQTTSGQAGNYQYFVGIGARDGYTYGEIQAGQLNVGTSSLAINRNGGNVGIGTSPADALLTVGEVGGTGSKLTVNGNAAMNGGLFASNNIGIGTNSPDQRLVIKGGHVDTTFKMYSNGDGGVNDAYLSLWASEPGWTYTGVGIGNNINGHPYYGRISTSRGASYIRLVDSQIRFSTISSSGTNMDIMSIVTRPISAGCCRHSVHSHSRVNPQYQLQ